jgi:hypothetical protein
VAAEWQSNLGAFLGATERALLSAAIATAETAVADQKQLLEHGYTSGAFVTGNNVNAVVRGDPVLTADGVAIAYGSTNLEYALPWELGHMNLFTGKFERVETWVPNMIQNRDKYAGIFAAEVRAVDGAL